MRVRKAVIPVAGLGTRLLPATKCIPKELVPVVAKPAVQWVIESAAASGIEEVIFVTSAGKGALEDHFDRSPELERILAEKGKTELLEAVRGTRELCRISSVRQHAPLGLGHAVLCARELVGDEPFAVILPDEIVLATQPALRQCLDLAEEVDGPVIGIVEVPEEDVSRYGIVAVEERDEQSRIVTDLVEKPAAADAPSRLAITGPYVLVPEIFETLDGLPPGAGGEIQLTDGLRILAGKRGMHGRIIEGRRLDVGHPLGFVQANVELGLADSSIGPALHSWLAARLAE
jgi:UTP--glucose-1-phosphate uridylyltransferase